MKRKIKVAVFCEYFHPHKNGVANYVEGTYSLLMNNLDVSIITYNTNNQKVYEEYNGFKIHRINCMRILGGTYNIPTMKSFFQVRKIFEKEKYDVLNTHTRFFTINVLGYLVHVFKKIKLIHTEHGTSYVKHPNKLVEIINRIYDQTIGRIIISGSNKVIGISKASSRFAKKLGAKDTAVIYNGVPEKFDKYSKAKLTKIKEEYNIKSNRLNVCFVGRIIEAKGVQDLLKAINTIDKDLKLYIIGDGNYKTELLRLTKKLKLTSKVVFLGEKDRQFIMNFLLLMDVFVNPSYSEGLPTSILEAGLLGLNVIATNVGGTSEIILHNKTGILIDVKKPDEISKSLLKLDKNLAKNLKREVNNHFTWKQISKKLQDIIYDVVK